MRRRTLGVVRDPIVWASACGVWDLVSGGGGVAALGISAHGMPLVEGVGKG